MKTPNSTPTSSLIAWSTRASMALLMVCAGESLAANDPSGSPSVGSVTTSAAVTTVNLPFKISATSLDVPIPSGCTSCRIELRLKGKTNFVRWRSATLSGKPTSVSIPLPKSLAIAEWRATGTINAQKKAEAMAKPRKFPEAFYQGRRSFTKSPTPGYQTFTPSTSTAERLQSLSLSPSVASSSVAGTSSNKSTSPSTPASDSTGTQSQQIAEADIWKAEGSTVYFFNQLRGLQVIDLADPANPKLSASLRMPATGQDLYVLPEQKAGERLVALLTLNYSATAQTEVVIVKVSAEGVQEISRTPIAGSLCDSRMLGNRLYVVSTDWSYYWYDRSASNQDQSVAGKSPSNLWELIIAPEGSVRSGSTYPLNASLDGNLALAENAIISAGNDWLAVSTSNWIDYNKSRISLYRLSESGISPLTSKPVVTAGRIQDKFKVSFQNEVLSAVSIDYSAGWRDQITRLENFKPGGEALAQLEIKRGEQLYATRFTQGKMYAVTFEQKDPLWVIDLADPAKPEIKGHVEVPGFSTYIEPMGENGEFLFTIGLDQGRVEASLFNVENPSKPNLIERVPIDEKAWGYSEATYNEKALKVLPEDGLALIPFTSASFGGPIFALAASDSSRAAAPTEPTNAFVQLLDINLKDGGSLKTRGRLYHQFEPRRATVLNGALTSISQKELITAKIDDRDNPEVLSDVSLAWPVDQAVVSGDYLLQLSDGSSAIWSGEQACIKISKTTSEDSILKEIPLGEGSVQDAVLRDSKLYVLRKNWGDYIGMVRFIRSSKAPAASVPQLCLDIYDAANLPELPLLGSVAVAMNQMDTNCAVSALQWVSDTLPVVLTQSQPSYFWRPMVMADAAFAGPTAKMAVMPPNPNSKTPRTAILRPFNVANPKAPVALNPLSLSATLSSVVSAAGAGDGLFVFGYAENPVEIAANNPWASLYGYFPSLVTCNNKLGVVDFSNPTRPVLGKSVTLPGRLLSVQQVARDGFLAYTEALPESTPSQPIQVDPLPPATIELAAALTMTKVAVIDPVVSSIVPSNPAVKPKRTLQANLIVDSEASLITSLEIDASAQAAFRDRTLYVSSETTLQRWNLEDSAAFAKNSEAQLPWTPSALAIRGNSVVGTNYSELLRVSWPGLDPVLETWKVEWINQLDRISVGNDRSLYLPMGDYGVRRLQAK